MDNSQDFPICFLGYNANGQKGLEGAALRRLKHPGSRYKKAQQKRCVFFRFYTLLPERGQRQPSSDDRKPLTGYVMLRNTLFLHPATHLDRLEMGGIEAASYVVIVYP